MNNADPKKSDGSDQRIFSCRFYFSGLVNKVTLNCSNLEESLKYWNGQLGMTVKSKSDSSALLSFGEGQSEVELNQLSTDAGGLDRGTAFGRTAFAVPGGDLKEVESSVKAAGYNIQTPFVTLPTPGKADVQVVIFADPVSLYQLYMSIVWVGRVGSSYLAPDDGRRTKAADWSHHLSS